MDALRCTGHSNEPLKRKSCSAKASTIFESHFHGAKVVRSNDFLQFDDDIYRRLFGCKVGGCCKVVGWQNFLIGLGCIFLGFALYNYEMYRKGEARCTILKSW